MAHTATAQTSFSIPPKSYPTEVPFKCDAGVDRYLACHKRHLYRSCQWWLQVSDKGNGTESEPQFINRLVLSYAG